MTNLPNRSLCSLAPHTRSFAYPHITRAPPNAAESDEPRPSSRYTPALHRNASLASSATAETTASSAPLAAALMAAYTLSTYSNLSSFIDASSWV